jgi:hypothetical protein
MRLIGFLLFVQGLVCAVMALRNYVGAHIIDTDVRSLFMFDTWYAVPYAGVLLPLAGLSGAAVIGVLFKRESGWLLAMLLQGLILLYCLVLYFTRDPEPFWVYVPMGYSLVMVLYLNSFGVRAAFKGSSSQDGL